MELFKQYREVKDKLAELETLKSELEMQIFDALDSDGLTNKETPYGQFAIMGRKTWEYSNKIKEALLEISKKKKIEELKGIATLKTDSRHLRLIIPKEVTT